MKNVIVLINLLPIYCRSFTLLVKILILSLFLLAFFFTLTCDMMKAVSIQFKKVDYHFFCCIFRYLSHSDDDRRRRQQSAVILLFFCYRV